MLDKEIIKRPWSKVQSLGISGVIKNYYPTKNLAEINRDKGRG
jgi:hypothetical protein